MQKLVKVKFYPKKFFKTCKKMKIVLKSSYRIENKGAIMKKKIIIAIVSIVVIAVIALAVKMLMPVKKPGVDVDIYFVKVGKSDSKLVKVTRHVDVTNDMKTIYAMLLLINGPDAKDKEKGLSTEIPLPTTIVTIEKKADKYEVNLSKEFETGGGVATMQTRVNQVVKTMSQNADKPVYLLIDGKQKTTIGGEGIEIPQPLNPQEGFLTKIKKVFTRK